MRLFVYGSLKRGECNYHEVDRWVVSVVPARAPGRLYLRPDGYPALVVGSRESGVGSVPGELLELSDPDAALAHLDIFEGYYPGHDSEYLRVEITCTPISLLPSPISAWTYVCQHPHDWPPIASWPVKAERPAPYTTGRLKRPKN